MSKKIQWIEYNLLEPCNFLSGKTYLRHGGMSKGAYESLNLGDGVGDHPENVKMNRDLVRKDLQADYVVFAKQEHGNTVIEITKENAKEAHVCDAMVTREKKIALAAIHADCQAAIFVDAKKQIVGVVHAGWKGQVKNIYQSMVDFFTSRFGSDVKDLLVTISPSLGPCHAEFLNYKKELPESMWSFQMEAKHFDLWAIAKAQLNDAGITDKQTEFANICTFDNPTDYYSARRDHITGRHATVVVIEE